jgi:hypothetical protein
MSQLITKPFTSEREFEKKKLARAEMKFKDIAKMLDECSKKMCFWSGSDT